MTMIMMIMILCWCCWTYVDVCCRYMMIEIDVSVLDVDNDVQFR